jgi:malonate decarboxylase epsilon subunit
MAAYSVSKRLWRTTSLTECDWHDATSVAQELGCQLFLEMPPGHTLSDLVRENLPEVEAYPVISGSTDRLFKRAQS